MHTAFQCVSSLILLQLLLSANVTRLRLSTQSLVGAKEDPADPLYKARIAHSNASENIPALCLLILCAAAAGLEPQLAWAFWGSVVARVLHAVGILTASTLSKPHPLRGLGGIGTLVLGFAMAINLLLKA
jgi:uncharacterized membrane protein YecN with MAPEG domain